jgi:hypothetical protein
MSVVRRGDIFPFICFLFFAALIVGGVLGAVKGLKGLKDYSNEQKEKTPPYEILTVRGCEYLKLIGTYGYGVAIIEVADQPSTCKYNMVKLSGIKKR